MGRAPGLSVLGQPRTPPTAMSVERRSLASDPVGLRADVQSKCYSSYAVGRYRQMYNRKGFIMNR